MWLEGWIRPQTTDPRPQTIDPRPQTTDLELRKQLVASEQEDSAFLSCLRVLYTILIPFGEGNGNPLQYSGLENPMGGGAW